MSADMVDLLRAQLRRCDAEREALLSLQASLDAAPDGEHSIVVPIGPMADMQKRVFLAALVLCKFNKVKTAKLLGITRRTVFNMARKYVLAHA